MKRLLIMKSLALHEQNVPLDVDVSHWQLQHPEFQRIMISIFLGMSENTGIKQFLLTNYETKNVTEIFFKDFYVKTLKRIYWYTRKTEVFSSILLKYY